jgi:hypothetical protein
MVCKKIKKIKPVGGEGDGKMEKKMETCYTAVADSFNKVNADLVEMKTDRAMV